MRHTAGVAPHTRGRPEPLAKHPTERGDHWVPAPYRLSGGTPPRARGPHFVTCGFMGSGGGFHLLLEKWTYRPSCCAGCGWRLSVVILHLWCRCCAGSSEEGRGPRPVGAALVGAQTGLRRVRRLAMWALTAEIWVRSGVVSPAVVWVWWQGRQSPSGRASGWPGRPQSVHSTRMRRVGMGLSAGVLSVAGRRGGSLSMRRRRIRPTGESTWAGSPAVRALVR